MAGLEKLKGRLTPVLIVPGFLCALLLAGYVPCYFAFSTTPTMDNGIRVFNAPWQAFIYMPATRVESWLNGEQVHPGYIEAVRRASATSVQYP